MTVEPTDPPPPVASPAHRQAARAAYGVYAYIIFLALGLSALVGMLLPGLTRRRTVARAMSRTLLRFAGMPLVVNGAERIPKGQCVIVSNHASYLDGLVFTAALPPRFGFVIKREMERVPVAGTLLRRLGHEFVERFNRNRGGVDARRVLRTAVNGNSLVFFPEGTFAARPGLGKFHAGAFTVAVRAGCPIVPAVIRGTRRAFPPQKGWPRPSRIEIEFLEPIYAATTAPDAAVELRDRARTAILDELKEPDLAAVA
ncbi:MAG TPA: lysophospholipid acyltransferase family protein [Steroidobacteraceae bacterium]|nr:lysophospholipid acyltransferase family protein [Steroidobacteraceae bacterium]